MRYCKAGVTAMRVKPCNRRYACSTEAWLEYFGLGDSRVAQVDRSEQPEGQGDQGRDTGHEQGAADQRPIQSACLQTAGPFGVSEKVDKKTL